MLLIEYYREFCASATESLYIFWWSLAKSWHFSVSRSSYSCPLAFEHIGYRLLIHKSLLCLECGYLHMIYACDRSLQSLLSGKYVKRLTVTS